MAKIYGALEVAQLEWFTDAGKPAPASYIYRVIYVSDLKQIQVSDGTTWRPTSLSVYTSGTLPAAAASNQYLAAFLTDTLQVKVSNGTAWITVGARLDTFTSGTLPAAASNTNQIVYVSDLKQVQVSDGTNWIAFVNTSTNQTLSGVMTFSGAQVFSGQHRLSVTTSVATGAITALSATTPVVEFTGAVTSIAGIVSGVSGATVMIVNRTGASFAVLDNDATASANDRIRTGTGAQIILANNASLILTYVGDSRWHVIGGSGSTSTVVACRAYKSSGSHITTGTDLTVASWTSTEYDTNSAFNLTTGTFTAPFAGTYHFSGTVAFGANATGSRVGYVAVNGTKKIISNVYASFADSAIMVVTGTLQLNASDAVTMRAFQNSGGALGYDTTTVDVPGRTQFNIFKVS